MLAHRSAPTRSKQGDSNILDDEFDHQRVLVLQCHVYALVEPEMGLIHVNTRHGVDTLQRRYSVGSRVGCT